jgi:phage FluMu protein Com
METHQFTCGHCGKLMAVARGDLGAQVRCPHCQQVVQAPAGSEPPAWPPEAVFSEPPVKEEESIFSPPEETGDDLFGAPAGARLELPPEPPAAPQVGPGNVPSWLTSDPGPALQTEVPGSGALFADGPAPAAPPPAVAAEQNGLAAGPVSEPFVRSAARPSQLGVMTLIFLIPYAVVTTAALLYVLYLYRAHKTPDPLEKMIDPYPRDEGPPERVQHDRTLPENQKTALNQPIQIGDLNVKPLEVKVNQDGDLILVLFLKNTSTNTRFNPMPDRFLWKDKGLPPYTYLQIGQERIYGGHMEWSKHDPRLGPGEEMTARLIVLGQLAEDRARIEKVRLSPGPLLWRVHVRRGLSEVRGQPVSTTAVIGVRFSGPDVKDLRKQGSAEARATFPGLLLPPLFAPL